MHTSNYNILLAEDDPEEVFLMQRAFQKAGSKVPLRVVRDGQMVLDYLARSGEFSDARDSPISVLLLDLKMPRKNGFEVLRWVRQQSEFRQLIVIVFSSSGELADINQAYDLGANSYLVKPTGFEALINLVKTIEVYWLNLNQSADLRIEEPSVVPVPQDQPTAA